MNAYAYLNISEELREMLISFITPKQVRVIPKENNSEVQLLPIVLDSTDEIESVKLEHRIEIKNAGIVIVWPYLDRFFQMLEMTEKGLFKKLKRFLILILPRLELRFTSCSVHKTSIPLKLLKWDGISVFFFIVKNSGFI